MILAWLFCFNKITLWCTKYLAELYKFLYFIIVIMAYMHIAKISVLGQARAVSATAGANMHIPVHAHT